MIDRRTFLAGTGAVLLAAPLAAGAQQAGKVMAEIHAVKQTTSSIPVVMIGSVDPVGNGLVGSLARPGGNITGRTVQPPEFGGKLVALLKEAVPQLSRLAVVWDPAFPGFRAFYEHAEIAGACPRRHASLRRDAAAERCLESARHHSGGLLEGPVLSNSVSAKRKCDRD